MKLAKIISFGLAPKDVKEKAPGASPVSSLGRLPFTSCVIRDSPFRSRAPLALASPFACCPSVTSRDFPNWFAGYQSVISYSTTLTSDQTIWMFWCSVELWNFKKNLDCWKIPNLIRFIVYFFLNSGWMPNNPDQFYVMNNILWFSDLFYPCKLIACDYWSPRSELEFIGLCAGIIL